MIGTTPPPSGILLTEPLRSPPTQVMTPPVAEPSWLQKKASDRLVPTSVSLAEMNRVPLGRVSLTTIALTGSVPRFETFRS